MRHRRIRLASYAKSPMRIGIALAIVLATCLSLTHTLANAIVRAAPRQAFILAPYDGRIAAAAAIAEFERSPTSDTDSRATQLAHRSLRFDATAVDALTVLALQAQLRNDSRATREIFNLSLRLSRRELRPRLWAIEEAVIRGDLDTALKNYDIALRTSRQASPILFPILAAAIDEDLVLPKLIQIMSEQPVWAEEFISFVATQRDHPELALRLFLRAEDYGLTIDGAYKADVVNGLAAKGQYGLAWGFYQSFREGASRERSRDPQFSLVRSRRTVFDWVAGEFTTIALRPQNDTGQAEFSVPPTQSGVLLQQYQMLPPGTYRLQSSTSNVDQPPQSRPRWVISCLNGSELAEFPLPNAPHGTSQLSGVVSVPRGCGVQTLALIARPTNAMAGTFGRVERIQLEPLGALVSEGNGG